MNEIAGEALLLFQRTYSSRRLAVEGRVSHEVTRSVVIGCLMLLVGCMYLFSIHHGDAAAWEVPLYLGYAVVASVLMIREVAGVDAIPIPNQHPPVAIRPTWEEVGERIGTLLKPPESLTPKPVWIPT